MRKLDIDSGIHTVSYTKDNISFLRESFISYPDKVMAVKCVGTPAKVIMERNVYSGDISKVDDSTLCMEGQAGANGVKHCLLIRAIKGNIGIKGRMLHCSADSELLITSETNYYVENYMEQACAVLEAAQRRGYDELKKRHIADVSALTSCCVLSLEYDHLNDSFTPVWDSKYTININTQMKYWPAEVTGLSQLHSPLFEHIKRMVPKGEQGNICEGASMDAQILYDLFGGGAKDSVNYG